MTKAFSMRLDDIQPSQLFISSKKLSRILKFIEKAKPESVEPIPVKRLDDQVVFVDGHTRAFAVFLRGLKEVKVYWEDERLDWDAYRICVDWCKKEGIHTIADLRERIVSPEEYRILWLQRCGKMQRDLGVKRRQKEQSLRAPAK